MSQSDTRVKKALKKFGLTENEISVYQAILKIEETSPYAVSKATSIARTTVYDVLTSLSLKGLIELNQSDGFSKQQTRIKAKNPSCLRKILKERRSDLMKTEVDIVEILPFLKGDYHKQHNSSDFQYYPGIEGARKVYLRDMGKEPRVVFENMMPMDVFGIDPMNKLTDDETRRNIGKGIDHRELIASSDWTKHVISYQYGRNPNYLEGRQLRFIDNPIFDNKLHIAIQSNRIYIACANDDEVWGLIITSQTLSNTLRSLFEVLWMTSIPLTAEIVESLGENEFLTEENRSTNSGNYSLE